MRLPGLIEPATVALVRGILRQQAVHLRLKLADGERVLGEFCLAEARLRQAEAWLRHALSRALCQWQSRLAVRLGILLGLAQLAHPRALFVLRQRGASPIALILSGLQGLLMLVVEPRRHVRHVHEHAYGDRHVVHRRLGPLRADVADGVVGPAEDVQRHVPLVVRVVILRPVHLGARSVVHRARDQRFPRVVHRRGHEVRARIRRVDEFLWLGELDHRLLEIVERPLDEDLLLLVEAQQVIPQRLLRQHLRVTYDYDAVFSASQCHVQSSGIVQESDALVFVRSHARHDYYVLLSALERVDAGHLDLLVQLRVQGPLILHVLHQVGSLTLVRSDHADLFGLHSATEEPRRYLLHVRRLRTVQVRRAASSDLLLPLRHVEEHWFVGGRPGEVDLQQFPLVGAHAVLQRTFVEKVGGEPREIRVHAVLYFQSERSNSKYHQSLEQ